MNKREYIVDEKYEVHQKICLECLQDKKFQPYLPNVICLRRGIENKGAGIFTKGTFYTVPIIEREKDIPKHCEYYFEHLMVEQ